MSNPHSLVNKETSTPTNDKLCSYYAKIRSLIRQKLDTNRKEYIHKPTLFGDNSEECIKKMETALKIKQIQMKEGEIGQLIIGNFIGWVDLKTGHSSKLDCMKTDGSIIIEIKNRHNTCNGGSRKTVHDNLSNYKKNHPNTRCILGILNPRKNCKLLKKTIQHDGVEIERIEGDELLKLIFTLDGFDYSKQVIDVVRQTMYHFD